MRIAKNSLAFYRLYNKNYVTIYVQLLIQFFLKKGNKQLAYKNIFIFLKFIKYKYKCKNIENFLNMIFFKYRPRVSFLKKKDRQLFIYYLGILKIIDQNF